MSDNRVQLMAYTLRGFATMGLVPDPEKEKGAWEELDVEQQGRWLRYAELVLDSSDRLTAMAVMAEVKKEE